MKRLLFFLALLVSIACHRPAFAQPIERDTATRALPPILQLALAKVEAVQTEDSTDASQLLLLPYRDEILAAAQEYHLPAALIAGVIQQESVWDQWAEKSEPAYLHKRVVQAAARAWSTSHRGLPSYQTELQDRSRSMGLMQPMGELAREQGFSERYLSALFIPKNSIEQGAKRLRHFLNVYHDTSAAISAYNQGNARMRHGSFVNARYVYLVHVGWQVWKHEFGEDTINVSTTEGSSKTNTAVPRRPARRHRVRQRVLEATSAPYLEAFNSNSPGDAQSPGLHDSNRHEFAGSFPSNGSGESALRDELERSNERATHYGLDREQYNDALAVWVVGITLFLVSGYAVIQFRRADPGSRHAQGLSRRNDGLI